MPSRQSQGMLGRACRGLPRIALFQLLSVNGQWERAAKQLTVLQQLDDEYKLLVQSYGALLTCELFRQEVFAASMLHPFWGNPSSGWSLRWRR